MLDVGYVVNKDVEAASEMETVNGKIIIVNLTVTEQKMKTVQVYAPQVGCKS